MVRVLMMHPDVVYEYDEYNRAVRVISNATFNDSGSWDGVVLYGVF